MGTGTRRGGNGDTVLRDRFNLSRVPGLNHETKSVDSQWFEICLCTMLQINQTFCEYHPGITEFCLLVHFSFSISGFCPVLHLRFSQLYARGV